MRIVAGIWLGALVVGIIAGWAVRTLYYDEDSAGDGGVDPTQAAGISTARAATAAASGTIVVSPGAASVLPTTNTVSPTTTPQPAVTLSGRGATTTEEFTLQRGFNVITSRHTGAGQFRANLVNATGETVAVAAAGRGDWQGTRSVIVLEGGAFHFEVTGEGAWELAVERVDPGPETLIPLPAEVSGERYGAVYFFPVENGPYTVEVSCETGPIRVAVSSNNFTNRRTVHEGECPQSVTLDLTSGRVGTDTIAIDITSTEGTWTVAVRQ